MLASGRALLQSALTLPSWNIRWDNQVGLTINLGDPHLEFREPTEMPGAPFRMAMRRLVYAVGTHSLWIAAEVWRIQLADGTDVRRRSSARLCRIACARLSGERLTTIAIDRSSGSTDFLFDLGGKVRALAPRAWVHDPDAELWSLRGPRKRWLGLYAGGRYAVGHTDRPDPTPRSLGDRTGGALTIDAT
jgi:hypothetical protein